MQKHLEDSTLQIAGSASLFYIIRKVNMNRDTKRDVVTALLNGMEAHMEEQVCFCFFSLQSLVFLSFFTVIPQFDCVQYIFAFYIRR